MGVAPTLEHAVIFKRKPSDKKSADWDSSALVFFMLGLFVAVLSDKQIQNAGQDGGCDFALLGSQVTKSPIVSCAPVQSFFTRSIDLVCNCSLVHVSSVLCGYPLVRVLGVRNRKKDTRFVSFFNAYEVSCRAWAEKDGPTSAWNEW